MTGLLGDLWLTEEQSETPGASYVSSCLPCQGALGSIRLVPLDSAPCPLLCFALYPFSVISLSLSLTVCLLIWVLLVNRWPQGGLGDPIPVSRLIGKMLCSPPPTFIAEACLSAISFGVYFPYLSNILKLLFLKMAVLDVLCYWGVRWMRIWASEALPRVPCPQPSSIVMPSSVWFHQPASVIFIVIITEAFCDAEPGRGLQFHFPIYLFS